MMVHQLRCHDLLKMKLIFILLSSVSTMAINFIQNTIKILSRNTIDLNKFSQRDLLQFIMDCEFDAIDELLKNGIKFTDI